LPWFNETVRGPIEIGTTIHIEEDGAGEPLVLIHGLTLDVRMWQPQVAAFSPHFRVIRYDLRGFGNSADPRPGRPYKDRVDLEALLDALAVPAAHFVGLSRGGRVALEFAVQNPRRVRNLVLIDTALRFRDASMAQHDSVREIRHRVRELVDQGKPNEAYLAVSAGWH
jgi:pimeloyl-ACP methyl ester carboxylesterase